MRRASRRSCNKCIKALERRLPLLQGRSLGVGFLPALTAGSRKLYSNREHGQPVYAASYLRRREIILDQELEDRPREMARILTHELFHFAWVRLNNQTRRSWEAIVRRERRGRAQGELGWSAESRKLALTDNRRSKAYNPKLWREYLCESFCDTAAWLFSGVHRHREFTLAERHRRRRAEWFRAAFAGGEIPI